jgi:hypothetical protein
MHQRQTLHIFHDGNFRIFGFTPNRTGGNLPKVPYYQAWKFHATIEVMPIEPPRAGVDVDDIQAEIELHGFCLKENIVQVFRQAVA